MKFNTLGNQYMYTAISYCVLSYFLPIWPKKLLVPFVVSSLLFLTSENAIKTVNKDASAYDTFDVKDMKKVPTWSNQPKIILIITTSHI